MALTITVNISDADQLSLENDLIDIDQWVQNAVAGKIDASKKRMVKHGVEVLKADPAVANMPADNDGIIAALVARPDYKNRSQRGD
ncbi:MAG: hypothetical protein KAJ10_11360 [Thermodesulfovibrionia bacterium]|nr:hypothetical protein [Thermodesulfovibrionia bacterium]